MNRITRLRSAILLGFAAALLSACAAQPQPAEIAAAACHEQAKRQVGERPLRLDLVALAASMRSDGRNDYLLSAPVVVNVGTVDETTQQLECNVRISDDQASAEVLGIRFIW